MKKILAGVLLSFLLLGLGIVIGNKIGSDRKNQTSPVTNNYQKEYEKTSEKNKTLKSEIAETKKPLKAKEDKVNQTKENTEIQLVTENFVKGYFTTSTSTMKEDMKQLYPTMTKDAQENLVPFHLEDKNMESIETEMTS